MKLKKISATEQASANALIDKIVAEWPAGKQIDWNEVYAKAKAAKH